MRVPKGAAVRQMMILALFSRRKGAASTILPAGIQDERLWGVRQEFRLNILCFFDAMRLLTIQNFDNKVHIRNGMWEA